MDKLKMQAKPMDIVLKKVMEICPAAVQDGKVDFDRLCAELSDVVDDSIKESYDFTWVGKRKSIIEANKPINKTLRPCKEESKNWDTTKNLYIEGDNLEVLKLLQESYLNKVKMIYIDPPYNTGKDFIYKDNFKQSKEDEAQGLGLFDEEGNRLFRNTETNGRFHSDWCSMIYPRLKLARDFLSDDGVIFISIDDNEVANLRKICDEVFGEDNFIGDIIRKTKSTTNDAKTGFNIQHENCLVFAKNKSCIILQGDKKTFENYTNPDNDPKGAWVSDNPSARTGYYFEIKNPYTGKIDFPPENSHWRFSGGSFQKAVDEGKIVFKKEHKPDERGFIYKRYANEVKSDYKLLDSLMGVSNEFMNQNATKKINELFPNVKVFDYTKPQLFIQTLIKSLAFSEDIILDFFSGSSTTAHAVMQLNSEDGGNRKFIMVQLPEDTDKDSEAFKAGYKNICEIGKERIRRAGEKIKTENPNKDIDIGFRVLKLDSSNMEDVYYNPSKLNQRDLLNFIDNIKNDRKPLDLLFGVMINWGVSLSKPLSEHKVGNNAIYVVGDNDLVACFDTNITIDTITKMATFNPTRVVFRDSCFERDDAKINMMEIFKSICDWDEKQAKDNIKVI